MRTLLQMTHKKINRFQIDAAFRSDSDIIKIKEQYEKLLTEDMRSRGYTKVLDIDPAFALEFDGEGWKFLMTIHGVYVGKRKAWRLEGISQGKLIPRNIPQRT